MDRMLMPDQLVHQNGRRPGRMFTFASGGWVLLITGLICLGIIVWAVGPAIMRHMTRPPGDGKHIESYGLDLSNLNVPRDLVAAAMLHRDMVPVMTNPTSSDLESFQKLNDPQYGKYLVTSDRVIGVEINGEARAYPISVMYVHEIINDQLGGTPIAVTYNWPCDSTVVFDRRVNGETLEFHTSGLVYNSNLLMFDAHEPPANANQLQDKDPRLPNAFGSSLWSQLLARAVSGPAAKSELTLATIPAQVTSWEDWLKNHPHTTVLNREMRFFERYKDAAPTAYFQSDKLLFPVKPMPPADGPAAKTPVIAVAIGEARRVYPVPALVKKISASESAPDQPRTWTDQLGQASVQFTMSREGQYVDVAIESGNAAVAPAAQIAHAYWFAWHAAHPEDRLANP